MSPASRSKSKDKSSSRAAAKELQQKTSSKPSPQSISGGSNIPASAYNPVSGTFHALETSPTASSPPPHTNGRFRNIDETDEHSGTSSLGTGTEYDSISNNDSCSVESEDQKDKMVNTTCKAETIPGADNDKREKIRLKNERKHQRQRERRAQELHERCSGYLMSRKLEALAQQLVAMGFSSERATMALILNEGRLEESVAWLFESGEEVVSAQQKVSNIEEGGSNLKIDISEELARIAVLETRFKCTKQEVERALVTCEGDLDKAAETLRAQKQETASSLQKPEETGGPPAISNSKLAASSAQTHTRTSQVKVVPATVSIQQRRDERSFNYTKVASGPSVVSQESANRNFQLLRLNQPNVATEWSRPQQQVAMLSEKRWPSVTSPSPPISYSLTSPLQAAPPSAKAEVLRSIVEGGKNIQTGGTTLREPVIMIQRPQSINTTKPNYPTSSLGDSPPITTRWYQNGVNMIDLMKANGEIDRMQRLNISASNPTTEQQYYRQQPPQYQPFVSGAVNSAGWGSSWNTTSNPAGPSSSSSLAVPSSLGLFSGWGSTPTSGSSSPVDWNMGGSMPQCDYTNVDWSLEATSSSPSRPNGLSAGFASYVKHSGGAYENGWPGASSAGGANMLMRSFATSGGLQERSSVGVDSGLSSSAAAAREWTSPFAGKDLFRVPRQYVTSPSP